MSLGRNLKSHIWDKRYATRITEVNSYVVRTRNERPRVGNPRNQWVGILEIPLPTEAPCNNLHVQIHLDTFGNFVVTITNITMMQETVYQLEEKPSRLLLRLGYYYY